MPHNLFNARTTFQLASGKQATLYSLPALEAAGLGEEKDLKRLGVSCVSGADAGDQSDGGDQETGENAHSRGLWQ